jgi:ABC-type uncharacterized transport system ATPase subunit
MAFLSVEHISKTFPGVRALDDVSVEFEKASVHAVMGENGAGKSTLGKIIAGVYTADQVVIKIEGQEVKPTDSRIAQRARDCSGPPGIGFLSEYDGGREPVTRRVADQIWLHGLG